MKNDKRGFTLVELLTVILILGLLMAIAIPSIFAISSKMKNKAYDAKIDLIEKAAVVYAQENSNAIKNKLGTCTSNSSNCECTTKNGKTTCNYRYIITLDKLIDVGAFNSENKDRDDAVCDVLDPTNSDNCLDCGTILIKLDASYKTATATYTKPNANDINKTKC